MRSLSDTGDLLDEGLRLYRRHVGALLRFSFGPSLAMSLIIGSAIWYAAESDGGLSGTGTLVASGLACFPLLIFLSTGVLHGVAADAAGEPLQARRMAWASLRRLVRALVLAWVAIAIAQVCGIVAAGVAFRLLSDLGIAIRSIATGGLSWQEAPLLYDVVESWSQLIQTLSGYMILVLAAQLPSALMLYLIQHDLSRLARPTQLGLAGLGRTLWLPVAAAVLSGTLVLPMLLLLAALLLGFFNSPQGPEGVIAAITSVSMLILWTLSPLQPIWIALLYRRNRGGAQGEDLAERVRVWQARHTAPTDEPQTEE